MYCNICGNKISDDAVFCTKCGTKFEKPAASAYSDSKNYASNFSDSINMSSDTPKVEVVYATEASVVNEVTNVETVSPTEQISAAEEIKPTPVAAPQPTPVAVPQPTPVAVPQPTPVAVPQPTPVAAPQPTPVAAPQPTPVAAPQPTPVAVPQPTPVAAPQPTPVATPQPTPVVAPQPTPVAASQPKPAAPQPTPVAASQPKPVAPQPTPVAPQPTPVVTPQTTSDSKKKKAKKEKKPKKKGRGLLIGIIIAIIAAIFIVIVAAAVIALVIILRSRTPDLDYSRMSQYYGNYTGTMCVQSTSGADDFADFLNNNGLNVVSDDFKTDRHLSNFALAMYEDEYSKAAWDLIFDDMGDYFGQQRFNNFDLISYEDYSKSKFYLGDLCPDTNGDFDIVVESSDYYNTYSTNLLDLSDLEGQYRIRFYGTIEGDHLVGTFEITLQYEGMNSPYQEIITVDAYKNVE